MRAGLVEPRLGKSCEIAEVDNAVEGNVTQSARLLLRMVVADIDDACILFVIGSGRISDQAHMTGAAAAGVDAGTVLSLACIGLAEIVAVEASCCKQRILVAVAFVPVERRTILDPDAGPRILDNTVIDGKRRGLSVKVEACLGSHCGALEGEIVPEDAVGDEAFCLVRAEDATAEAGPVCLADGAWRSVADKRTVGYERVGEPVGRESGAVSAGTVVYDQVVDKGRLIYVAQIRAASGEISEVAADVAVPDVEPSQRAIEAGAAGQNISDSVVGIVDIGGSRVVDNLGTDHIDRAVNGSQAAAAERRVGYDVAVDDHGLRLGEIYCAAGIGFIIDEVAVDEHHAGALLGSYAATVSDVRIETMVRIGPGHDCGCNVIFERTARETHGGVGCTVDTCAISRHLERNQRLLIAAAANDPANSTHASERAVASYLTVHKGNITSDIAIHAAPVPGIPSVVTYVRGQVGFTIHGPEGISVGPFPGFPEITFNKVGRIKQTGKGVGIDIKCLGP